MLPAEIHAELTQLLQALQSPDNNIRTQAEDHLQNNWTATRPEVLLMGLAEQISASTDAAVRNPLLSLCDPAVQDQVATRKENVTNAPSRLAVTLLRRRHLPSDSVKDAQE